MVGPMSQEGGQMGRPELEEFGLAKHFSQQLIENAHEAIGQPPVYEDHSLESSSCSFRKLVGEFKSTCSHSLKLCVRPL